ncbi:MAG TPA: DinB family protein [Thermomicrobiales bacterium]
MSESLVELFRHNAWANQRLFDACAGLSDAQLDATVVGTFGSIRNTLVHIVGAQERYVAALAEAGPVRASRERAPFPGLAELRDGARTSGEALVELAAQTQSGATVTTTWRGEGYTLPVWLLLVQAINHATEHRAQVAAILTQLGIEPPGMDGWTYHETCFDGDWSLLWAW